MFSVVIPAYNCESTIVQVLDSVKNQTRIDLIKEIIIINDGSTDNTDKEIRDYIKKNSELNIIYETQENYGASTTRNRGILKSSAEWIALLDSDDLWLENKIERQYDALKKCTDISFMGSAYPLKFLFHNKNGLYKVSAKELCIRSCPVTPSVIFKREVAIELGLFDENRKYCEDIQFFQKFLMKDTYYVLVEPLVKISFQKKYFAETGLTANLKEMHKGRNQNIKELYEMRLISFAYYMTMKMFNYVKYYRRLIYRWINKKR